jgi:hypothetical protein
VEAWRHVTVNHVTLHYQIGARPKIDLEKSRVRPAAPSFLRVPNSICQISHALLFSASSKEHLTRPFPALSPATLGLINFLQVASSNPF